MERTPTGRGEITNQKTSLVTNARDLHFQERKRLTKKRKNAREFPSFTSWMYIKIEELSKNL